MRPRLIANALPAPYACATMHKSIRFSYRTNSMNQSSQPTNTPPTWLLPVIAVALLIGAVVIAVLLTQPPAPNSSLGGAAPAPAGVADSSVSSLAPVAPGADATALPETALPAGHGDVSNGPPVTKISVQQAATYYAAGTVVFVDVRSGSDFSAGHIAGAVSFTSSDLEQALKAAPADGQIVVYSSADKADSALRSAQMFTELGYPNVVALDGGFQAWMQAGYPVESQTQ